MRKPNATLQWYGAGSEVLYQTDVSGNNGIDYIFMGGRRLASYTESTSAINHYFQDALGSTRLVVASNSNSACYDADFYPYGGERVVTSTCPQTYKFTGMMRDGTGDDHTQFRQFMSNLGRWMSPDPMAGDVTNPQSLNRYAYVMNNPTTLTDPLGLDSIGVDPCGRNPHKAVCGGDAASSEGACMEAGLTPNCSGPMGSGELEAAAASWQSALDISFLVNSNLDKQGSWTLGGTTYNWVSGGTTSPICQNNDCSDVTISTTTGHWEMDGSGQSESPGSGLQNVASDIPFSVSGYLPLGRLPRVGIPVGAAGSFSGIPGNHFACLAGGVGTAYPPTKGVSGGPLLHGNVANAVSILNGWSISLTVQATPTIGYQVIANFSGVLAGPTFGTTGASLTYTGAACGEF